MIEEAGDLLMNVATAGFAAVGIEDWLKNFMPKKCPRRQAALMLPLAAGCFCAVDLLPRAVAGSLLTVGAVQLCYETLVQGLRALVERASGKLRGAGAPPPPPMKERR